MRAKNLFFSLVIGTLLIGLVLLSGEASAAAGLPATQSRQSSIYAIEFGPVSEAGGLDLVIAAGSDWVRSAVVPWDAVEPLPGERNWDALAGVEAQWLAALEAGITPIVVVKSTPAWAQLVPGYSCGPVHPDALEAFGDFLFDLVSRYSGPPFNLRFWEIWNEPDISPTSVGPDSPFGCWGDMSDPFYGGRYYGEMLAVVSPRIKEAHPNAQVLVGGLALDCDPRNPPENPPGSGNFKDCSSSRFLTGILEAGGGAHFDGISFHAYDYYYGALGDYRNPNWGTEWDDYGPSLFAKSRYLYWLLKYYHVRGKYLMNTETALLCGATGQEDYCLTPEFQATKAYYLARSYAAARTVGLKLNLWYLLRGWRGSELVDSSLAPLPAYQAYEASRQLLEGTIFQGYLWAYPGVGGYRFQDAVGQPSGRAEEAFLSGRNRGRTWILWSQDGETHSVTLPTDPDQVFDVYGNPLAAARTITVSLAPVYAVWNP